MRLGGVAAIATLVLTAGLLTGCDSSPVVLQGTVTYGSGALVGHASAVEPTDLAQPFAPNVTITLYANDTESPVAQTTTNLLGAYEFHASNVTAGSYRLRVGSEWHDGTSWADATPIEINSSGLTVNHTLAPAGSIGGSIVDGSFTGIPNAVVWTLNTAGDAVATTATDSTGAFTLGIPTEGTYTVAFGAGNTITNIGGATSTAFTIDAAHTALATGMISATTGLVVTPPPVRTAAVTVTGATAADGLKLQVTGSGFTNLPNASTGSPNQGVYVALRDPATMTNDAINADNGIVPAVNFVYKATIVGGNFTTNLTAPAASLDPDANYEVIVWVAHGNITPATLLTTTPVTLTSEQHTALFG